jgi:hypothetical protein
MDRINRMKKKSYGFTFILTILSILLESAFPFAFN